MSEDSKKQTQMSAPAAPQSEIAELSAFMKDFAVSVKLQFEKIDRRFDAVDARLDKIEARLDKVEARLDKVEARLDKVEERLDRHDMQFELMLVVLSALSRDSNETKVEVQRIHERLDRFDGEIRDVRGYSVEIDGLRSAFNAHMALHR